MKTHPFALCLLLALPVAAWAQAADETAEARRRGIPLAQLQAENALNAEKQKTADAEKTLADLNKKIADLQAAAPAPSASPESTTAADGATMYKDFVRHYLSGNWDKLDTDITAHQAQIAALPQSNQDDLAYIKQAVQDGHQSWWDSVKAGKSAQFKAAVWKNTITVNFSNNAIPKFTPPANAATVAISWPMANMDSFDPMSMMDVGLSLNGNFRKGDGINQYIWGELGLADAYLSVGADKIRTMNAADKAQFTVYAGFRTAVTACYYGTPGARRLMMVQALASFETMNDSRPDWLGKRPLGAAILIEMRAHGALYKSIHIETIIGLSKAAKDGHEFEQFQAKPVVLGMSGAKLTFEEDKAFREVFKTLAEKNTTWNVSKLALPNDLSYDLNVQADLPLSDERKKFLGD